VPGVHWADILQACIETVSLAPVKMVRKTRKMIAVSLLTLLSVSLVSGAAVPPPEDPIDKKATDNEASVDSKVTCLPKQSTTVTEKVTNSNKEIKTDNIPKTSVDEVEKKDSVTEIRNPKKDKTEPGPKASPLVDEKQANENPFKENSELKDSNIKDEPAVKESENKNDEEKTVTIPKELDKPPSDKMEGLADEGKLPEAQVEDMREVTYQKNISPGGGEEVSQSNFLGYFIVLSIITIIAYLVFHNKKKILGLIVEGRGGRQAGRRRSGGREYRKLDSNMEDMLDSGKETSMRQVIY